MHAMLGVVAAMSVWAGHAPDPELKLVLQMDQTAFASDDAVKVRVFIENVSHLDVVLNSRMLVNRTVGPHELFFLVTGPDAKAVPFQARIRDSFESQDFIMLHNQQVFGRLYDLGRAHFFEQKGEYSVAAFYENQQDAPAELKLPAAWKGRLKSNTLTFTIR